MPYISAAMLDQKDQKYFDLSGSTLWSRPTIVSLNINDTYFQELERVHNDCGYAEVLKK